MYQREEQQCVLKSKQFHVEIRKQNLGKIFGLKRIKPILIESDQDALYIFADGMEVLKSNETSEETLLTAIKSISSALRKYEFNNHHKLINDLVEILKQLFDFGSHQREIVKEAALQVFLALSMNSFYGLKLSFVPFEVLKGYNIEMIKSCLTTLSNIMMHFEMSFYNEMITLIKDIDIFEKMLTIHINFWQKIEIFELIKVPFLCCAIPLCYINYQWVISRTDKDAKQLLKICISLLEDDIVKEGQKDDTLKAFFLPFYRPMDIDQVFDCANELSYPFGLIEFITKIVKQVNVDVLATLTKCLHFQITTNSIQRPLVKCIIKIFSETEAYLEDDLKEEVFDYIFSLEWSNLAEEFSCLRQMIILAINHSANNQILDESIFKYTGDSMNFRYPKTCHLLEVMQYLELKEDTQTQHYLMELIENYVTCNGCLHYFNESLEELVKFKVGRSFIEQSWGMKLDQIEGLMVEEQQERWELNGDVQI